MDARKRYDTIIGEMSEEKLLQALLTLGALNGKSPEQITVQSDLIREAETRYPATEELMKLWIADDDREGTYAHALVAAIIAVKEFGL